MQIRITEMMCSTESLLNISSSTRPVPHPPTVAEGPPPERDMIDMQSSYCAQKAFEGLPPEECVVKQARSEAGVGTAHGLPPEECVV